MKKRILFLIAFVIIVSIFAGCNNKEKDITVPNNNNQSQIQEIEKQLNELYELDESMTTMQEKIGTTAIMLEDAEITQKYNLGTLAKLEKKVLINSSDDNYEEVAIIKLTNNEQEFTVQQMLHDRYKTLKDEYKDNEKILNMLENSENIKIKVQEGIGVLIVSNRANELLETFDNGF